MLDPNYIRDRIRTVPDWPELGGSKRLRDAGLALHTRVTFEGI
jgi:hypothetical protein